ncbi:MAG: hypothetical protein R3E10_12145 [Gemmatimonadota bacterium]
MRTLLWCALAPALSAHPAGAQDLGFISAFFEKARGVAIAFQFGQLQGAGLESDDSCPLGAVCGASAEVLIDLADFGDDYGVELGFSASYWRGFRSSRPELDLRGSTRNFPTLAAYISRNLDPWSPYVGLSFGLSDLWNAQAYDEDGVVYPLAAQTFDWGLVGGLGYGLGPAYLISEVRYSWRTFTSLDWTLPASTERLPSAFPRSLELSGFKLSLGLQFQFKDEGGT